MNMSFFESCQIISILCLPLLEKLVTHIPDVEFLKFTSEERLSCIEPGVTPFHNFNALLF